MRTIIWWLVSLNIFFLFVFSKCKRQENKDYEAVRKWEFSLKYISFGYTHADLVLRADQCGCSRMHSTLAWVCRCMCERPCASQWVCMLEGQSAIVQQQPQGLLLPPTRHNKEQLNAAALPAEEPTASHTSTNRQICLKPKGRSNKSQPTGSNPLQSPSADSNQKVTGWLHRIAHYHRSGRVLIICAVLHVKLAVMYHTRSVRLDYTG